MTTADGIRIEVNGVPRAQPRGRHTKGRVVSTTGHAVCWRALVREATLAAIEAATADGPAKFPILGPVELVLHNRVPTREQERWGRWYTAVRRLDADNLAKLVMDVVTQAGVLADDGQVARLVVESRWVAPAACGAVAIIRQLGPGEAVRIDAGATPDWLGGP